MRFSHLSGAPLEMKNRIISKKAYNHKSKFHDKIIWDWISVNLEDYNVILDY